MGSLFRRLRERMLSLRAEIADMLVALLVPVSIALAGLVLGDALPGEGREPVFSGSRVAGLVVSLLLLTAAVFWRRGVYRGSGTLFSVQLLDEEMPDLHQEATERAARKHMHAHVLTRRFDIRARTIGGVVELVDVADALGHDLAKGLNQDRDDTGYAIAPNMLWPTAVAMGRWLNRVERIRFIEFGRRGAVEFRLADCASRTMRITVTEESVPGGLPGRRGVWLAFTEAASDFSVQGFAAFGVDSAVVIRRAQGTPNTPLDGPEMCSLARSLAKELAEIRRTTSVEREIVVVAMIPKTVALLLGWHLSQEKVRFFGGAHLMYYDPHKRHYAELNTPYLAFRVHPSQPRHFPTPSGERS